MLSIKRTLTLFILGIILVGFEACKNDKGDSQSSSSTTDAELQQDTIHLTLEGNDGMQFNTKELVVGENQTVVLKLVHTGKMPKANMGHNFVLLESGVTASSFGRKAAQAKDNDYIPESDKIIAHTKLLGGGESDEITFKAPAKGEYPFLCTFPGHYAAMNGKFIVK